MPPFRNKPPHRDQNSHAERSKKRICKCKSHCTTLNILTGLYEGDGHLFSRQTQASHARDDRILAARSGANPSSTPPPRSSELPAEIIPHYISLGVGGDGSQMAKWITLMNQELQFLSALPTNDPLFPLVFVHDPISNGEYIRPTTADVIRPNNGPYTLRAGPRVNASYLAAENRFCELITLITGFPPTNGGVLLVDRLVDELVRMNFEKELHWAQQRARRHEFAPGGMVVVNTEPHFYQHGPKNPTVKAASLISLVMQNILFTPIRGLRAHLAGLRDLLGTTDIPKKVIEMIPKDPRTISQRWCLDPVTHSYLCCSSCHSLYPYNPGAKRPSSHDTITRCTHKRTPQSNVCDAPLWECQNINSDAVRFIPRKKYLHQDLKFWVGRLLSRRKMEEYIDEYPRSVLMDENRSTIHDIWQSKVFLDLKDANGRPFFPAPVNEGRLVFSLSVDSFNPFYNKIAKQSVSSTGIWLVVLNLPPHLRYLPENIFLAGVIPGPNKPSSDEINHSLGLVVDDLLEFWVPGVFFSRTHKFLSGRLFHAMLIPLVADMLAIRQVIGFQGSTVAHYCCTFCDIDIDDIDILDPNEWPKRNAGEIRQFARLWKDASCEKHQDNIRDAFGWRWSVLLKLPYWDPVLFSTIDSMHALDLNLLQNHCRNLFRIDITNLGGEGMSQNGSLESEKCVTGDKDRKMVQKCLELVSEGGRDMLFELLNFHRTKHVLAKNIVNWRRTLDSDGIQSLRQSPAREHEGDSGGTQDPQPTRSDITTDGNPEPPMDVDDLPDNVGLVLARRIIRHFASKTTAGYDKAYSQGSVVIFRYVCGILAIDHGKISTELGGSEKRNLFEAIIQSISDDESQLSKLTSIIAENMPTTRAVLGKDVMEAIWADMAKTQLPTWVGSAPKNWGTTQRGKLSADQWRIICTIHLPITLIRLWKSETGRKKELLDNFMDLVSAVRIANMRVSTCNQIRSYETHMFRYVSKITTLYPDEELKPTHHAALHVGSMLNLFGPVHSHSAPFFERFINFFHSMNTNNIVGELDSTFMETSARYSNLRAVLADDEKARATVIEMTETMESIPKENIRGSRLSSMLDPGHQDFTIDPKAKSFTLGQPEYKLLQSLLATEVGDERVNISNTALSLTKIAIRGVYYGTSKSATYRNSAIIFQSAEGQQKAGIIDTIFQHSRPITASGPSTKDIYLVVREYMAMNPTSDGNHFLDPYSEFGFAGGFLCQGVASKLHVLGLSRVVSHFALTKMSDPEYNGCIHVLPLNRLMLSFRSESFDDSSAGEPDALG